MDIGSVHGGRHDKPAPQDAELTARARLAELADTVHRDDRTEEIRHDRVILAQERVETAFYSRDEIRHALVDRLAQSHDLEPSDDDTTDNSRLEQIKHRIRQGEYLRDDVLGGLADRLIDVWSDDPDRQDDIDYDGNADS